MRKKQPKLHSSIPLPPPLLLSRQRHRRSAAEILWTQSGLLRGVSPSSFPPMHPRMAMMRRRMLRREAVILPSSMGMRSGTVFVKSSPPCRKRKKTRTMHLRRRREASTTSHRFHRRESLPQISSNSKIINYSNNSNGMPSLMRSGPFLRSSGRCWPTCVNGLSEPLSSSAVTRARTTRS